MRRSLPVVLVVLSACGDAAVTAQLDASHPVGDAPHGASDASHAADAVPRAQDGPIEGGTVLGACGLEMSCPTGALCVYPEGNCSAKAVCVEVLAKECGKQTQLTGCDGGIVYTRGCAVGGAYATGPTTPFALSDGGN